MCSLHAACLPFFCDVHVLRIIGGLNRIVPNCLPAFRFAIVLFVPLIYCRQTVFSCPDACKSLDLLRRFSITRFTRPLENCHLSHHRCIIVVFCSQNQFHTFRHLLFPCYLYHLADFLSVRSPPLAEKSLAVALRIGNNCLHPAKPIK